VYVHRVWPSTEPLAGPHPASLALDFLGRVGFAAEWRRFLAAKGQFLRYFPLSGHHFLFLARVARLRPAADMAAIFLAPYFLRPMAAAMAAPFLPPPAEAATLANLPPPPSFIDFFAAITFLLLR